MLSLYNSNYSSLNPIKSHLRFLKWLSTSPTFKHIHDITQAIYSSLSEIFTSTVPYRTVPFFLVRDEN